MVIPYYNGSGFIERSVQSVFDQTVTPTEFIVVDDGSSSEESRFLDEVAHRMGFQVLRKANGGQGSARNAGVAASKSDFICFLDQDDFYLDDHIETLIGILPKRDPHLGWVYGDLFEAERSGDLVRTSIVSHNANHPKTNIFELLSSDMFVLPSAAMVSRVAFESVGGFDEQFMGYEDDDLFLRIFRSGYTNYFTSKAVTVWCIHSESTSNGIKMARSRLKYFKKLTTAFPDDRQKHRYYARDCLIPRFSNQILGEAIAAASGEGGKFRQYQSEYIELARDYASVVRAQLNVPRRFKYRLDMHVFLLQHRFLHNVYRARPFIHWARRVWKGRRSIIWG